MLIKYHQSTSNLLIYPKLRYALNLLDENIQAIVGTLPKHTWKELIRGIKPSFELKDEQGNLIGKYMLDEKKEGYHTLYQSDDSILLKLHIFGYFNPSVEIRDSGNNLLAKISSKMWTAGTVQMENSNGEKVLACNVELNCTIQDKNGKNIAELKTKRFKNDWTLNIHDPHFDRKMILGFSLAMLSIMNSGPAGVSNL